MTYKPVCQFCSYLIKYAIGLTLSHLIIVRYTKDLFIQNWVIAIDSPLVGIQ